MNNPTKAQLAPALTQDELVTLALDNAERIHRIAIERRQLLRIAECQVIDMYRRTPIGKAGVQ